MMPTKEVKKVALYCRVSTDEQTTETQKLALTTYCQRRGWEVVKIVEEVKSSGKTRPSKNALYQIACKDPYFDAIVVYRLDRWARSLTELVNDIKILHDNNIYFISITENIDFSTATGQLQFHIFAAFAEFERQLIRQRTMEGLARAKAQGKTPGRRKGQKDRYKGRRKKSGYYLRWASKKTPPLIDGVITD
jgi:putative DNA-invertase from lambdoid prophage Rac